jgi:hypothetical protein
VYNALARMDRRPYVIVKARGNHSVP